jgi:hypothetical protein
MIEPILEKCDIMMLSIMYEHILLVDLLLLVFQILLHQQYDNLLYMYEIHTAHIIIELSVLERQLQMQAELVDLHANIRLIDLFEVEVYGMVRIAIKIFSCPIPT